MPVINKAEGPPGGGNDKAAAATTGPSPSGPTPIDCNVKVVVRTRPMLTLEKRRNCSNVLTHNVAARSIGIKGAERGDRSFTYDGVIPSRVSQEDTYRTTARPMLDSFFQGYNQTIMAYGQTGSGKTFTMGTAADETEAGIDRDSGILPRFIVDAFSRIAKLKKTKDVTTSVSFLEVYNEQLKDLLSPPELAPTHAHPHPGQSRGRYGSGASGSGGGQTLTIVEGKSGSKSVMVKGLSEVKVTCVEDVLDALARGTQSRTTAATLMNNTSSRSHAVFTLTCVQKPRIAVVHSDEEGASADVVGSSADDQAMVSKATFVDLAGSERIKRTGAEGKRKEEGISINEGLLSLGRVINALADEEALRKGTRNHVPYRNSKLTRLLQDALGGNSRTLFIACVSPADDNCEETLGTLRYAHQARNIKNAAVLNVDPRAELLGRLQRERQAFLHQALIYRFSAFDTPLEDLMKRGDVQSYVSSILEQINPDAPADVSWGMLPSAASSSSPSGADGGGGRSSAGGADGGGGSSSSGYGRSKPPQLPRARSRSRDEGRPGRKGGGSKAGGRGSKSGATSSSSSSSGGAASAAAPPTEAEQLTVNQERAIKNLESSELQALLETQQNSILEQELEMEKRDRLEARESEAHNEQVDSLRVQISTKEDLLRTIKDSLTRFNELKEKEREHAEQLRESEHERQRLEKQLKQRQTAKPTPATAADRKKLEKKYKEVVDRLKSLKSQHERQQFLLRNLEREAARAAQLERAIAVLKSEKVSLARSRKREITDHRHWKKEKETELARLRKLQQKQKRELQSVTADRERQRIRLERRGDQLQHAAARLRETRMELVALLQKKNKVSRRRNANARGGAASSSSRGRRTTDAALDAKKQEQEDEATQKFRAHAVHSKLVLLQQEIMRRAAVQTKEEELERELEKRQHLLLQLTNLVGARQQLAEDGLGDLTEAGAPPASEEEQAEALAVELAAIDSKIEGCEMKIAAVTGTLQECAAELKVLNSERRTAKGRQAAAAAEAEEDATGIDPVARTVLDVATTNEEGQYMLSQLMNLACELQCSSTGEKKALKLAEAQREEAEQELQKQLKRFRRLERQWEQNNAQAAVEYEKDILAIVKHGVADSILESPHPAQHQRQQHGSNKTTPRKGSKAAAAAAAAAAEAAAAADATPLARNRQNKLTELLRDKVAELEALTIERDTRDREIVELREKCAALERTLTLAGGAGDDGAGGGGSDTPAGKGTMKSPRTSSPPRNVVSVATSSRVAALTKKWKELGVDAETQEKIMQDLQMSVDERAEKYLSHLGAEYAELQENVVAVENEIASKLALLGKTFVPANVYSVEGSLGIPPDSVLDKKRKLQEYLVNVQAQVQKQQSRYAELRARAGELVDELAVKEDEVGDELRGLLNTEVPQTYAHKTMVSLEGAVRALIVTKSERLVIVQQRCRRLRKTLNLLGLSALDCLPCFKKFSQLSPRKNPLYNDVDAMRELCETLNEEDFSMSRLSLDPPTVRKLTLLNKTMEHVKAHRVGSIKVLCSILADMQFASTMGQPEKLSSELVERLNQLVGPLQEGPLAVHTLELLVNKLRRDFVQLEAQHETTRQELQKTWDTMGYAKAAQAKFRHTVELEKVEAARRKLCQVLDTDAPPDSVTNLSITGLENHSWPIPDLAHVYGACQSLLRLHKELERLRTAEDDSKKIMRLFMQLEQLEQGMEKFKAEVTENKDRWKGRSTNFALEEKTRKRFAAQYPRLLSQLVAKLEQYETSFGERYLVRGHELMPVLQEIAAANGTNNTNFELMQLRLKSVGILAVFSGKAKGETAPQQLDKYTRELLQTTGASPPSKAHRGTKAAKAAADADAYEGGACSKCGQPGHNKLSCPHNLLRGGP